MTFRDREKQRLIPMKPQLFSAAAQQPGTYNNTIYHFCLDNTCCAENLHQYIRTDAIQYFATRNIHWHDGHTGMPSNHLCCSQTCCVNTWFPYVDQPVLLKGVLRDLGYDVAEVLPFDLDEPLSNGQKPYVAFEWIGEKDYMNELRGKARQRKRGQNSTSSDFAIRFRRSDGKIQIVIGEWKYTEEYADGRSIQVSKRGTDRLPIYAQSLNENYCQIQLLKVGIDPEALFFDPFDQLMRLQLLASEMENAHEMDADIVSVLHVAPEANKESNHISGSACSRKNDHPRHLEWLGNQWKVQGSLF